MRRVRSFVPALKATAPAAQHRVGESLVATVPDDAVGAGVEHVMYGDRQFDRRQPRGKPVRRCCNVVSEQGAHFGGERGELRDLQTLQIRRQLQ